MIFCFFFSFLKHIFLNEMALKITGPLTIQKQVIKILNVSWKRHAGQIESLNFQ